MRDRSSRAIDYHPSHTSRGRDLFFYDPWREHKIDEQSVRRRADETRVIPDDLECVWVQDEENIEHTLRVDTRDYHPFSGGLILSSTRGQLLPIL